MEADKSKEYIDLKNIPFVRPSSRFESQAHPQYPEPKNVKSKQSQL